MAHISDIRNGMQVVGSDGGMIGEVDAVETSRLRVRDTAGGAAHYVPAEWIARVDEHVHLELAAGLARERWTTAGPAIGARAADESAFDRPARGSKWLWIAGAILLAILLYVGLRGFGYSAADPDYTDDAKGTLSDDRREATGVAEADANSSQ
ncbi:DUF2171 domain-containing protein [Sphingomonas sp. LY54]|uniref:DUF2171 domain-containing protein n=1 Tax=Sphingomonas sp. LY54 TaxID=3095343 RepID=UPI002D78D0D9|nr:DUF2171 domain-containing protein [Sphingomonas sp. LY54]WRP29200.1 DUF2171 domain-containing protein [Sphingomonas sp. LY54]